MRISILVPTYNRKELVAEAVDKIIKYDDVSVHEVIISDNFSSDGTLEYLQERYANYPKIRITQPSKKEGAITNWKHCLDIATGTHVHWHWSDDFLSGGLYSKARTVFESENKQVILFGASITENNKIVSSYNYKEEAIYTEEALSRLFCFNLPVSPAAYILPLESVKKHFYIDIPNYEKYRPMDIAMGTDALMIAGSILDHSGLKIIPDNLMRFRSHEDSITANNLDKFQNYKVSFIYFLRKNKVNGLSKVKVRELLGSYMVDRLWKGSGKEELFFLLSILKENGLRSAMKRILA